MIGKNYKDGEILYADDLNNIIDEINTKATSEAVTAAKEEVIEAVNETLEFYVDYDALGNMHFADMSTVADYVDNTLENGGYIDTDGLRFTTINFSSGTRLFMCEANNSEFIAIEPIEYLTIDIGKHEQDFPNRENHNYINSVLFTVADSENISITIFDGDTNEEPKYIGTPPDFKAGETWELNIKNGVIATGKVGA